LEGGVLKDRFIRFFELPENKLVSVLDMSLLGWEEDGEACKWRRRLLAWEEEHVGKCSVLFKIIVLNVGEDGRWQ
jgi:hypothetical protein